MKHLLLFLALFVLVLPITGQEDHNPKPIRTLSVRAVSPTFYETNWLNPLQVSPNGKVEAVLSIIAWGRWFNQHVIAVAETKIIAGGARQVFFACAKVDFVVRNNDYHDSSGNNCENIMRGGRVYAERHVADGHCQAVWGSESSHHADNGRNLWKPTLAISGTFC